MEIGLYYVCAIAGFILVGGSLLLIWKGRIYINTETKQVTQIELPLGIKLQTNLPVLAVFIVGAFLLAFPIQQIKDLQTKEREPGKRTLLSGQLNYAEPLDVDVVAAGRSDARGDLNLEVPRCKYLFTVNYWARNRTSKVGYEDIILNGEETRISLKGPNAQLTPTAAGGTTFSEASRKEKEGDLSAFGK